MNDVGVIDTFLNTFTSYIDSSFGLIKGEVTGFSSILIALDITLAGLFWAWSADEDVMRRLVRKTLAVGLFLPGSSATSTRSRKSCSRASPGRASRPAAPPENGPWESPVPAGRFITHVRDNHVSHQPLG